MAKIRKKSVVPVYTVAVIWIFWATCMPMYKLSHFIWLIVWSFMAYKLTGFIWRGKWVEVADPEPVYQPTGNVELDELALQFSLPVLARLPINPDIASLFDEGKMAQADVSAVLPAAELMAKA